MADTVTITREEYEDLIDARDAALAMRDIAAGRAEMIGLEEIEASLAAPLAFWRKRRGLTQAALAAQVGITQPYLAQLEAHRRNGDARLYAKLATALRTTIEDLLPPV